MEEQQLGIQHSSHIERKTGNRSLKAAAAAAASVTIVGSIDATIIVRSAMRSVMSVARSHRNNNVMIIIAAISGAMIGIAIVIASMAFHVLPRNWTLAIAMTVHRLHLRSNHINKFRQDAHLI